MTPNETARQPILRGDARPTRARGAPVWLRRPLGDLLDVVHRAIELPLHKRWLPSTNARSSLRSCGLRLRGPRRFDLASLGRPAVNLYAQQFGAWPGLKAAMISRVGDERMGRCPVRTLQREGCDTSMAQVDPERLTGLVLPGLNRPLDALAAAFAQATHSIVWGFMVGRTI